MKNRLGNKKKLDDCIESVKARQRNLIWPDVLRGGRSVDELLWKGARSAPLVQRIGVLILALAYVMVGVVFVSMSLEEREWSTALFAALIFIAAGWFIRNVLRR